MNAETRAKELLAAIVERGTGGWRFAAEVEESLPLIAAAITRAENDKLEEAAQLADERTESSGSHSNALSFGPSLSERIRSLKSKD